MKELSKKYRILIFTSRPYEIAKKWLSENALGIYIEDVTSIKLPCYLHIDDRAITHKGNFAKTLEEIENFRPHWK